MPFYGKSKIQALLEGGTQIGIQNALNDLIENKIVEYQTRDESAAKPENASAIEIDGTIKLQFENAQNIDMKNHKMETWKISNCLYQLAILLDY